MASSTLFLPALLASAAGVIVAITNITDTTLADHFHSLVNMISPRLRLYGWDLRTLIQVSERSNSGLSQVCFLPALPPGRQPALLVLQADLASRFVRHTQSPERRSSAVCSLWAEGDSRIVDGPLGTQSLVSQEVIPQFPLTTFSHRIACLSPLACEWTANRNRTDCKVLTWNSGVQILC